MEGEKKLPDLLYHYTSIDKLALILKNRTIRLKPLDTMDDLQEAKTKDLKNAGQYIFVSCWTNCKDESIPMWKMYTKFEEGVRIGLSANPFVKYTTTKADIEKYTNLPQPFMKEKVETFFDAKYVLKSMDLIPPLMGEDVLIPIVYTDDKNLLEPQVKIQNNYMSGIVLEKLGKYKSTRWSFQNEWRYRLELHPSPFDRTAGISGTNADHQFQEMMNGTEKMKTRYFDLTISEVAFSQMEAVASPKMSVGYKILLQDLLEKYNPNATLKDSTLMNLI